MPTYITLYKWTDEGAKTVKDTVDRAERATAAAEKMAGRLIGIYWTQGAYDLVGIAEWPDDDSAQAFLLQLASLGTVRSETLRAFTKEDMRRILSKLG